jgi:hypothetical protein
LFRKSIFEIEGELLGTGRIKRSLKTPDNYKSVESTALKLTENGIIVIKKMAVIANWTNI